MLGNIALGRADIFDNVLIHGDNLLALKALEQEYAGKVKCIYVDPPFCLASKCPAGATWGTVVSPCMHTLVEHDALAAGRSPRPLKTVVAGI